jgi:transcription termination factor NusB
MDFSKYTPTELLKISNDIKEQHNKIKENIIMLVDLIDENKEKINKNIEELTDIEEIHKLIIEEIENRK